MDDESTVRIEISETGEVSAPTGGGETADVLLRRWAELCPEAVAFVCMPNRAAFGLGPARRTTFAEADAIADAIAARLVSHGLAPGDIVALQLPNIWEMPVLMAAAWRARLIAVPIPMSWRTGELHQAFAQIDPAAVVTVGHFIDHDHAQTVREAAAHHISIRYIFGIGPEACDGVTPISEWFKRDGQWESVWVDSPADGTMTETAVMTWGASHTGPFPVPRTHAELLALGRVAARELQFTSNDILLSPYPLTGIAALGGMYLAALVSGATLVLHQPFDYDTYVAQLRDQRVTYTAVPARVIAALRDQGDLAGAGSGLTRIGCVWPTPHIAAQHEPLADIGVPLFDIHNLGEFALIVGRRTAGAAPDGLPLGRFLAPAGEADEAPYLETRVRGSVTNGGSQRRLNGELLVRGTTVPSGPFDRAGALAQSLLTIDSHGYLDTRIGCTVDEAESGRFSCERDKELIYHGGAMIGASELDRAYADYPDFLDAAAFAIEDATMGERIFAAVVPRPEAIPSLADLKRFLAEKGVAPYKAPDQIVIVNMIPRDAAGNVLRDEILNQI